MNRRLGLVLLATVTSVLVQQQVLLRRPPRLIQLEPQHIHSGSAALDLRFSRPMQLETVRSESHLNPQLPHRWLGSNNQLRLVVDTNTAITQPLRLVVAGRDQRMHKMASQSWWWDPRPWLLVTRNINAGKQLQLQDRQGKWRPLSPIWAHFSAVVPLGNGRGVAMAVSDDSRVEQIWLQPLTPRNLAHKHNALAPPELQPLQQLVHDKLLFGHLSSNLNGDLLIQTGGFSPDSERTELIQANGKRHNLDLQSAGPMELLPAGGGLIVPSYNGLNLQPLLNKGRPVQSLPGNRELGAFCAASGRVVLIRHWPDYRRSIELVIAGFSPRQLWLGEQAVLGVACDGSGERIWAVLGQWTSNREQHTILLMDSQGTEMGRRLLTPWAMKGGTLLQFDPVSLRLLMTVTRPSQREAYPAFLDSASLQWQQILPVAIEEALWLNP
ncbi:hypothetical protein [Synechococcus sp. M16CYN]|uniref:hypothetical protein n=1 Tax=Synechococcus sp. M16CYN TaxID=3103139 RepID=UPI00324D002A